MGPRVCPGGCRPPTACTTSSSAARWCWTMAGIPERFLVASSAPRGRFEGGSYAFWSRDVPNGLRHASWRARPCPRGARLRVPLGAGAHAHSGEPSKPVAWRSQPAEGVLARLRPIPRAHRGGDGDITLAPWHGNLPRRRARSHHHGERSGHARLSLRRAVPLRHRRWLERRGDGESRHQLQDPVATAPGARPRDEGDLDSGGSGVPWRVREFRPDLVAPEARSKTAPTDPDGGDGPTTFDRVVEFADGWMPLARSGRNPAEKIGLLRQRAEKAGRDPKSISVTIFFAKPEKVALEGLRAAGVERAIFGVPSEGRDSVLPLLDSYTRVMV